jgi:hypothetical protein
MRRFGRAATVAGGSAPQPPLDYYLIFPEVGDDEPPAQADAIVVEEFVLGEDSGAVGLNSAGWTAADGRWWSSTAFSRAMRADADLRARVAAVSRHEGEIVYRRLGGGELPDEETLRSYLEHDESFAASAPLRLSPRRVADGFHDTRVYRILFANDLGQDGLANLRAVWQMAVADVVAGAQARVVGTAHLRIADDVFTWDLRRIGPSVAWCLDLTANLAGSCADAIGPLLRWLTTVMRQQGLIPVTIERFS